LYRTVHRRAATMRALEGPAATRASMSTVRDARLRLTAAVGFRSSSTINVKARRCDAHPDLPETHMTDWNVDRARDTYAIAHWGEGYFDVDPRGRLTAQPRGAGTPPVALADIVDAARAQGSRVPLLLRFTDILHHRLARLQAAFARATADLEYAG